MKVCPVNIEVGDKLPALVSLSLPLFSASEKIQTDCQSWLLVSKVISIEKSNL